MPASDIKREHTDILSPTGKLIEPKEEPIDILSAQDQSSLGKTII